jgi:methionyl-tRNA synthetase
MITYDDFAKVEIRAGKILSAEKIPDTDKLLRLSVDFGEMTAAVPATPESPEKPSISAPRQIVSGISMHFPDPAVLVGRTCMFVTNLEPRKIRGFESNGMLFAVSTPDMLDEAGAVMKRGTFSLLEPSPIASTDGTVGTIPPGTRAK